MQTSGTGTWEGPHVCECLGFRAVCVRSVPQGARVPGLCCGGVLAAALSARSAAERTPGPAAGTVASFACPPGLRGGSVSY